MAMTRFLMVRDTGGFNSFGLPNSNTKFQGILLAAAEQTITVPETKDATYTKAVAVFKRQDGTTVWAALNATAAFPTGAFASTDSEENPQVWYVKPGDVIHMITRDTSVECGVSFYAVQ